MTISGYLETGLKEEALGIKKYGRTIRRTTKTIKEEVSSFHRYEKRQ
jgi:hypothetical protein